jgi:gentisate 1,2-dioxygenase
MQSKSDFIGKLEQHGLRGQRQSEAALAKAIGGPQPAGSPALWDWHTLMNLLEQAGTELPDSMQSRRSLIVQNPGLPGRTTHTMNMGVQMILPAERALAHRRSISAIRFVVKGNGGLYTTVDGSPLQMHDYDLIYIPGWTWHDHYNSSLSPGFWIDVLDGPLVRALNQLFYEPGVDRAEHGDGGTANAGGYRFPWSDIAPRLRELPVTDLDGAVYQYPCDDRRSSIKTLMCQVQRLPPGFSTLPRRRTSSAVYFAISGAGVMQADGRPIQWRAHDMFVVPNWTEHSLTNMSNEEDALLFSVHDSPTLRGLGLYRDLTLAGDHNSSGAS